MVRPGEPGSAAHQERKVPIYSERDSLRARHAANPATRTKNREPLLGAPLLRLFVPTLGRCGQQNVWPHHGVEENLQPSCVIGTSADRPQPETLKEISATRVSWNLASLAFISGAGCVKRPNRSLVSGRSSLLRRGRVAPPFRVVEVEEELALLSLPRRSPSRTSVSAAEASLCLSAFALTACLLRALLDRVGALKATLRDPGCALPSMFVINSRRANAAGRLQRTLTVNRCRGELWRWAKRKYRANYINSDARHRGVARPTERRGRFRALRIYARSHRAPLLGDAPCPRKRRTAQADGLACAGAVWHPGIALSQPALVYGDSWPPAEAAQASEARGASAPGLGPQGDAASEARLVGDHRNRVHLLARQSRRCSAVPRKDYRCRVQRPASGSQNV